MWTDSLETSLNFGNLLAVYMRYLRGMPATALDPKLGFSQATLYRLLYNTGARPKLAQVDALAAALHLTPQQRTHLYAAADYLPEPHESRKVAASWRDVANQGTAPVHLQDIRGYVWAWNDAWKNWFIAPQKAHSAESAHPARSGSTASLELAPGLHWLLLVYHPESPIRRAVEPLYSSHARWEAWALEEMVDFRRLTRRLIARDTELAWVDELKATLAGLPAPTAQQALSHWEQADSWDVAPPQVGAA